MIKKYTCVDIDPEVEPDIVFDLMKDWTFCEDKKYDKIIDTGGLAFYIGGNYRNHIKLQISRKLKENGKFYGKPERKPL